VLLGSTLSPVESYVVEVRCPLDESPLARLTLPQGVRVAADFALTVSDAFFRVIAFIMFSRSLLFDVVFHCGLSLCGLWCRCIWQGRDVRFLSAATAAPGSLSCPVAYAIATTSSAPPSALAATTSAQRPLEERESALQLNVCFADALEVFFCTVLLVDTWDRWIQSPLRCLLPHRRSPLICIPRLCCESY
jgi:hypothetical protein